MTSVQFGLGSSQRDSISYVNYLSTTILNGGDLIDFGGGPAYVDDLAADFTITVDADSSGTLTAGDIVTWNPSTSQHQLGAVPNLTFGLNAFVGIQSAASFVSPSTTLYVAAGTYNEQVVVTKPVSIVGATVPSKPVINFTGTVSGKPTLIDVQSNNVTLRNFKLDVDRRKLSSAIIASAVSPSTSITGLQIIDNDIAPYASSAGADFGSYGNSNAISVNYGGSTNYRVTGGGGQITVTGNTISGRIASDPLASGAARFFRSGVSMDECSGTFDGNTIQTINHDILARFGSTGTVQIQNNYFNGSGVQLSEQNAGVTALNVVNNFFDGAAAIALSGTAVLRLQNNQTNIPTTVSGNAFTNHNWGISLENFKNVSLSGNTFTPGVVASYRHITVNTKSLASNSASIVQTPISASITGNTFNDSSPSSPGVAIAFYNHDSDAASLGTFTLTGNIFNAGIGTFIRLDNSTGNTVPAPPAFPEYNLGGGSNTVMAPWTLGINAASNTFDVGSGANLPSAMSPAELFTLEDHLFHNQDIPALGLVRVLNAGLIITAGGVIQPAINASSPGDTVYVGPGTYIEDVTIDRTLTLRGAGFATTTISGAIGGAGSTVNITASNVLLEGFTITREGNNVTDWNAALNSGGVTIPGGLTGVTIRNNLLTGNRTGIDINNSGGHSVLNNVITNNRTGMVMRNQTDNLTVGQNEITSNWTVGVLFLDASGGTNSPVQTALNCSFSNNNISGNWYGQLVDRQTGGSLPAPGSNLKNFSANWLGSTAPIISTANSAEPGYAAQIPVVFGGTATAPGGQPDICGLASANIDLTPLLVSATDTNVETSPGRGTLGFQGNFSSLLVITAGAQTGAAARIQEGVNRVTTGGIVNVQAGTFVENVTVNKAATLLGANAGTAGSAVRVSETIVRGNGNQTAVFTVSASNVTIDGFTADGDDPGLVGGALASGDDSNTLYGVKTSGTISSLIVQNNIITRAAIGVRGDGASTGSIITRNWFDRIGNYDFGYAVTLRTNYYADVTNNLMTKVWSGLHTNNFSTAGGPPTWAFSGNEVHSYAGGLLYWLQYQAATPLTVNNNQISAETGAVANNFGILIVSIQDTLNPTFTNNTITGTDYGVGVFNVPTSNTITLGATNSIVGAKVGGVLFTNNLNFNPIGTTNFLAGGPGVASSLNITGLPISATVGAGVIVDASGGTATTATISGSTIAGASGSTGIRLSGAHATANLTNTLVTGFATGIDDVGGKITSSVGNTFSGGTTGIAFSGASCVLTGNTFGTSSFTGQSANHIVLSSGAFAGATLNASAASFNGVTSVTATVTQFFAIEDKLIHAIDDSSLGFIELKSNTVLITPNSFAAPATTAASVQRGIDVISPGGTVFVMAGTYIGDININKSISLVGEDCSTTTLSGAIGGASNATVAITANNVTLEGFTITREGNNPAQWNLALNIIGVAIQGTPTGATIRNNCITGNRSGIDINNSSGHSILNNEITNNRTGVILRNQTDGLVFEENNITDNWTAGVLFLDGSGGSNSPPQSANGHFFNNNISSNWYGQIVDRQSGGSLPAPGTNKKDFSGNWLGTTSPVITTANSSEPGYAAQIPVIFGGSAVPPGGQPDVCGPASANIDITPLLAVATDTDVETSPRNGTEGFQGDFNLLIVTSDIAQVGATPRIQEGLNLVNDPGTVKVLSGTYAGNVDATSQAVTLSAGASPGLVVVNGNFTLDANDTLPIEFNGLTPGTGFDQWQINGIITLGNATLSLSGTHTPSLGDSFAMMLNDAGEPVSGIFNSQPEGSTVTVSFLGSSYFAVISYTGGDGNDVVLTVTLPDIAVFNGNNTLVINERQDNVGSYNFGPIGMAYPTTQTFTIKNTGGAILTLGAIASTGSTDFSVTQPGTSSLVPGAMTTFTITFAPTSKGPLSASVTIPSNDANENPFDITVQGIGRSSDPTLSNLVLTTATYAPAFAPNTTAYSSTVPDLTTSITVTPTTSDADAVVTVNGGPVASGMPSSSISLAIGTNVVTVFVTAQDTLTTKTYTVTVTRALTFTGVATKYDTLPPGVEPGTTWHTFYNAFLNNNGRAIFSGQLGPVGLLDTSVDQGTWTTGSTGLLSLIVRAGDSLDNGQTVGRNFSFPRLADSGAGIVQTVAAGSGPIHTVQWIDDGAESATLFAKRTTEYASAPANTAFTGFSFTSQNQATGEAYFAADLVQGGAGINAITSANDSGVWKTDTTGSVIAVVREGDNLPASIAGNGFKQGTVQRVAVSAGDIGVYRGQLNGAGITSANVEVILQRDFANSTDPSLVARSGNQAAGLPAGARYFTFAGETVNASGQVLFWAQLNGTGVTGVNQRALFSNRNGPTELVLRYDADLSATFSSGIKLAALSAYWLLNDGRVVVLGQLKGTGVNTSNDLFAAVIALNGTMTKLVREGDTIGVAGNSRIGVLQFVDVSHDLGKVAILASLVGGSGNTIIGTNDQVLLRGFTSAPGTFDLMMRKGSTIPGGVKTIASITMTAQNIQGVTGSTAGMSRAVSEAGKFCTIVTFSDSDMGVYVGP